MIDAIRYFKEVVVQGNFVRAAWALKLSPPVLTKQIKKLEAELGYALFYRSTRKVTLTPKGQLFLQEAEVLLRTYQQLFKLAGQQELSNIRISGQPALLKFFVLRFLSEFYHTHPNVNIEFVLEFSPFALIDGTIDMMLANFCVKQPNLLPTKLFTTHRHLFASPSYLSQRGVPKSPKDLLQHDCLFNTHLHPDKKWCFADTELTLIPKLSSFEGTVIVKAALEGLGIINVPEEVVLEYVTAGQLVRLDIPLKTETADVYLIYTKHPKGHVVRNLAEFLEQKAQSLAAPHKFG